MVSRIVTIILLSLLAIIHAQLWLGAGSMESVQALRAQLHELQTANHVVQKENERLSAELQELREATDIIQEKARFELGMVKPHEIYVQTLPQ